jgi:integrase
MHPPGEDHPGSVISLNSPRDPARAVPAVLDQPSPDGTGLVKATSPDIRGARLPRQTVLTVAQVYALADAVGGRYRALVLLAVFGSLRWGELAALRRSDIDIQARTARVSRQLSEQRGGGFAFGPPKSGAGQRTVAIPDVITPDLASHLVTYAAPGDDGLVFTSPGGRPLRRSKFIRRAWRPALSAAGLPVMHFHDLRHTGNQLAAGAGANQRELMDRMGHSTTRAAMVYLHGSDERQQAIADALSRQAEDELGRSKKQQSDAAGTAAAERIVSADYYPGYMRIDLGSWFCAPGRIRTRDPLLRRSVCAAGQPAYSLVSRRIGLPVSDRKFPPLTSRSGTQRACRLRSCPAVRTS